MKKRNFGIIGFLVVLSVILVTSLAFADTVSGTGSWQPGVAPDQVMPASPYWDSTSSDGANQNVGYYLPGPLNYWGLAGGLADPSFFLTHSGPANDAELRVVVTAYDEVGSMDVFGWYDTTAPGTLHQLLTAGTAIGTSVSFAPSANYGFYLTSPDGTFRTQSGGDQHFAIFQDTNAFWIGAEDLAFNHSDKDYNDMIVKVSYTSGDVVVPEPTTLLLLGLGLIGVAGIRRTYKK